MSTSVTVAQATGRARGAGVRQVNGCARVGSDVVCVEERVVLVIYPIRGNRASLPTPTDTYASDGQIFFP
ncbi:hypothetical protein GCM10010254_58640 [Streptomyces chromofuscus]|nr:hypothetical protein GCM10010254_58640 [Streptomyces chromofuscus]